MTTGPQGPAAGRDQLRAGHADREQVIDALKTAFVDGRLTKNELAARTGRALTARTYADLAALTAGIPAGRPRPGRAARRPGNPPAIGQGGRHIGRLPGRRGRRHTVGCPLAQSAAPAPVPIIPWLACCSSWPSSPP